MDFHYVNCINKYNMPKKNIIVHVTTNVINFHKETAVLRKIV